MKRMYACIFYAIFFCSSFCAFAKGGNKIYNKKNVIIRCNAFPGEDSGIITIRFTDNRLLPISGIVNLDKIENAAEKKYTAVLINKAYEFRFNNIPPFTIGYFNYLSKKIQDSEHPFGIHFTFIAEPGDSVSVTMKGYSVNFSGNGAARYELQYKLEQSINNNFPAVQDDDNRVGLYYRRIDSVMNQALLLLEENKSKVSVSDYRILKSNIIASLQSRKFVFITWNRYRLLDSLQKYLNEYQSPTLIKDFETEVQKSKFLQRNLNVLNFLIDQYSLDSCYSLNKPFNLVGGYSYFTKTFTGPAREWMIYTLIRQNLRRDQDISYCLDDAFKTGYIKSISIKNYLTKTGNWLPGTQAYNYSLLDTTGKIVHLADLKGKTVLMDFWFNHCGGCAGLHPILDSITNLFDKNKLVTVSVYIDNQAEGIKAWKDYMASGVYTSGENDNLFLEGKSKGFGWLTHPLLQHYQIQGCPTLILIDKRGKLLQTPDDPRLDNGVSLIQLIQKNS